MIREKIIELTREALTNGPDYSVWILSTPHLERIVNQAVAAEREQACRIVTGLCISDNNAREICEAIRERSKA